MKRFPAVIFKVESTGQEVLVGLRMLKRDYASLKQHESCLAMLDITNSIMLETAIVKASEKGISS